MAEQLFEAGTSIGALLEEAEVAKSRRDLAAKLAIALREAREAKYWLRIFATEDAWIEELAPLIAEDSEFVAILTVSVRKIRSEEPQRLSLPFALCPLPYLVLSTSPPSAVSRSTNPP